MSPLPPFQDEGMVGINSVIVTEAAMSNLTLQNAAITDKDDDEGLTVSKSASVPSSKNAKTVLKKKHITRIFWQSRSDDVGKTTDVGGNGKAKTKDCHKVFTVYKCTKETCGKTWNSAHGWEAVPKFYCEYCDCKAKVTKQVEGMLKVEEFRCTIDDNSWSFPHDPTNPNPLIQYCDLCETAIKSNVQERFGRQYWVVCQNKACGIDWEEVDMENDYTQRCSKRNCFGLGKKIGTRKETDKELTARMSRPAKLGYYSWVTGDNHFIEGCDMCQKLIAQRIAPSCTRNRRILVEVKTKNGLPSDRVIAIA